MNQKDQITITSPGRPDKDINYSTLDRLCKIQCTGEECAAVLGLDYETLNTALKRDGNGGFKEYFAIKSKVGHASLRRRQYQSAENGNVTMQIWLGKQWLNQKDRVETESGDIAEALKGLAEKLPD